MAEPYNATAEDNYNRLRKMGWKAAERRYPGKYFFQCQLVERLLTTRFSIGAGRAIPLFCSTRL